MDENNIEGAQFYKELAYRALTEEPSSLSMEFKETAKAIKDESKYLDTAAEEQIKKSPVYWGEQPMTQGPVYIGSIVFLLFFLV